MYKFLFRILEFYKDELLEQEESRVIENINEYLTIKIPQTEIVVSNKKYTGMTIETYKQGFKNFFTEFSVTTGNNRCMSFLSFFKEGVKVKLEMLKMLIDIFAFTEKENLYMNIVNGIKVKKTVYSKKTLNNSKRFNEAKKRQFFELVDGGMYKSISPSCLLYKDEKYTVLRYEKDAVVKYKNVYYSLTRDEDIDIFINAFDRTKTIQCLQQNLRK